MEIIIERLQLAELDSFFQIFSELLQKDFPVYSKAVINYFLIKTYSKSAYHYWLTTGWKIVLIAKNADAKDAKNRGEIIGFAVIDKPYGGVCFLRWLGVLEQFRHQGAGEKLINTWISYAKNYGCHKVELASQPEAKDFYQKCGLNLEGERQFSYFGINQPIFGKVIGRPSDLVMTTD